MYAMNTLKMYQIILSLKDTHVFFSSSRQMLLVLLFQFLNGSLFHINAQSWIKWFWVYMKHFSHRATETLNKDSLHGIGLYRMQIVTFASLKVCRRSRHLLPHSELASQSLKENGILSHR